MRFYPLFVAALLGTFLRHQVVSAPVDDNADEDAIPRLDGDEDLAEPNGELCSTPEQTNEDIEFLLNIYEDNGHDRSKLANIASEYKPPTAAQPRKKDRKRGPPYTPRRPASWMGIKLDKRRSDDLRKLDKHNLTWTVKKYTDKLTKEQVNEVFERAFSMWSAVTPLRFTYKESGDADFEILFVRGRHEKGKGVPGLEDMTNNAHSFYPPASVRPQTGGIHFNDGRNWKKKYKSRSMLRTALHEIGHSLGLGHSSTWLDVMYSLNTSPATLSKNDIRRIQKKYGPPVGSKKQPGPAFCSGRRVIDAVTATASRKPYTLGSDKYYTRERIYVFKGDSVFDTTFGTQPNADKSSVHEKFPEAPTSINAALCKTNNDGNEVMRLFNGTHEFQYIRDSKKGEEQFSLVERATILRKWRLMPEEFFENGGIDAALYDYVDDRTYFFKGNKYWDARAGTNAMLISQKWPGLPDEPITAACYEYRVEYIKPYWGWRHIYAWLHTYHFFYADGSHFSVHNSTKLVAPHYIVDNKVREGNIPTWMGCYADQQP